MDEQKKIAALEERLNELYKAIYGNGQFQESITYRLLEAEKANKRTMTELQETKSLLHAAIKELGDDSAKRFDKIEGIFARINWVIVLGVISALLTVVLR